MRLLAVSNSPSGTQGGSEASFETIAEGLTHRGYDVVRLYNESGAQEACIRRLMLPWFAMRGAFPTLAGSLTLVNRLVPLAKLLRQLRPEVVLVHFVDISSVYFALLKPLFRYRLVLNARGSDLLVQPATSKRHQQLLPFVLRRADLLVALSEPIAEAATALEPAIESRTMVIHNGIDFDFWSADASPVSQQQGPPYFVAAGRLHRVKGFDVLIEAFAQVRHEHPAVRLRIYGEGPERGALQANVARLGLSHSVEFLGWASPLVLREAYGKAMAVVVPSRSEGFGNVAAEAMAAGAPVVASAVGGLPGILGGVGSEVPPDHPEALAQALLAILRQQDGGLHMRARARERAARFTWSAALDVYDAVLSSSV